MAKGIAKSDFLASKYRSLDGEATECRLWKHCGCMLNSGYIWLCKSCNSKKIHLYMYTDQKQEIKIVWPKFRHIQLNVLHRTPR